MAGRRPLKGGAMRMLGNHHGFAGKAYRRSWDALEAHFGPETLAEPLMKLEAGRVAAAWVNVEEATRALQAARQERANGRGRRPGVRDLERLSRRQGLADGSYSAAFTRFSELALRRHAGPRLDLATKVRRASPRTP